MSFLALYEASKQSRETSAAMALVGLSGIDIRNTNELDWDLEQGFVVLKNKQAYYPLSKQAIELLQGLRPIDDLDIRSGLTELGLDPEIAHTSLSGALWTTSEDGLLMQEMLGLGLGAFTTIPLELTYPYSVVNQLHPNDLENWHQSTLAIQNAVDWLLRPQPEKPSVLNRILDGKLVFLLVSTGVSGLNLIHNLVMGRILSPSDYGQMTFLNTLLLIAGLIPTAMQTVAARYSAVYSAQSRQAGIIQIWRYGVRRGWVVGLGIAITIMLLAPLISDLFQLRDAFLLLPIALAIPFFMATGTERGILQGKEKYYWLAAVYLIEAIIRLGLGVVLALLLVNANRSLDGAVWALMQSLVLTWFVAWFALRYFSGSSIADTSNIPEIEKQQWMKLFGFTAMALFGQALITNSDFILVKSYFDSFDAGLYAAISVIGRIVYFGTMPLTVVMIPLIAKQQALGKSTRNMLFILIGSGFALCSGLILVSALFASNIVEIMYGTDYLSAAYLLPLYTISAALFVMTNLLVTYRVALGKGSETWMPLFAGVAQIFGVILFHDTLQTVIIVQIIIMTALFGGVTWQMRR